MLSESLVCQISICFHQTVVPVELSMGQQYFKCSSHRQLHNLLKLPTILVSNACTYFLLVATHRGLMSVDLNAAKNSSQTAVSQLCGPEKQIIIFSRLNNFILELQVWYFALSRRMTVSSRHPGRSLSNCLANTSKKISIIFAFELFCMRLRYTCPFRYMKYKCIYD